MNFDHHLRSDLRGKSSRLLWFRAGLMLLIGIVPATFARADIIDIDAADMDAIGVFGNPNNSVQIIHIGPHLLIDDISWENVKYESFEPSWQNELVFSFSNSDGSGYWDFGISNVEASGVHTSSGGVDDMYLPDGGPFQLLGDGQLHVTVWENWDDAAGSPDASVQSGTFKVSAVPEPTSLTLLGLLAPAAMLRRKRHS